MQWLGHHHAHIQVLHAEIFKPTDVFSQDTPCVAPCIWNHTMSRCVLQVCGRTSVFNYQTLEMALDCFLIASATSAWSNTLRAAFGNTNKNRKVNDGQALTCQLTGVTWGGGRSTPTERTSGLKSGATAVSNPKCRWGFGVGGVKLLWQRALMDLPLITADNEWSQTEFCTLSQTQCQCVNQTS